MEKCIMKKSKILTFVIALAIVVSCFAGATSVAAIEYERSDVGTYFYFGEESQLEAKPGETFTLYLGVADLPKVCTLYANIDWEHPPVHGGPVLPVPKPVVNTGLFVNGDGTAIVPVMTGYQKPADRFRICYDDSANYSGEWDQDGIFATATFTMPEDAIVGSKYEIILNADPAEVYNLDMHEYVIDSATTYITVAAPATEAPATEAPASQAPATQAPATEAPATQAPATEAPATQAPATEAPATEAPATEAPATEAPATEAPATKAPATEAPATKAPATEAPAGDDNANTGDSFAVFAAIAVAIVMLGAVVVIRRKKA